MSETFELINGAWHGGWAWRPVSTLLRAAGHTVLTPTLPGFPERLGVTAIDGPGSHEACFARPAELAASFLSA
jgi:hypothetical protein